MRSKLPYGEEKRSC